VKIRKRKDQFSCSEFEFGQGMCYGLRKKKLGFRSGFQNSILDRFQVRKKSVFPVIYYIPVLDELFRTGKFFSIRDQI